MERPPTMLAATTDVLRVLERTGLVLQQDAVLPSVTTLVTGETLATSWWSHPAGRRIFAVLVELDDHPDVLFTKLLGAKVTLVHRKLWPALLAVAAERAPWQMTGLTTTARRLLESVDASEEPVACSGPAAKELEVRLLVQTEQVHTESGRHRLMAQPWESWARARAVKPRRSASAARVEIESVVQDMGGALSLLPWHKRRR